MPFVQCRPFQRPLRDSPWLSVGSASLLTFERETCARRAYGVSLYGISFKWKTVHSAGLLLQIFTCLGIGPQDSWSSFHPMPPTTVGGGVTPCPRVCSLLSLLFLLGSRPPGTSVLVTRCGSLLSGAVMRMSSPMNTGESPHHSTSSPTRAIIELLRFYQFDQCKMAFSCCFNSYGMKPTAAWDVLREGHRCPPVLGPRHGVGNGNR